MSLLKLKILLVDDDQDYINILTDYLEAKGHTVFKAENINEAEEIVHIELKKLLPIDLAFIDYVIPDNDGIQISKRLKEIDPNFFRVGLTEHDNPETIKKLIQQGAFMHIISKFDDESETIDRMLAAALASKKERKRI